jgi:hypothetical protein
MHFEAAFALHELGRHDEAQARADQAIAFAGNAPRAPGARRIHGRVVDRTRRPVAGATLVAVEGELRGDPTHLIQPDHRWTVAFEGHTATTDAAGEFTLMLTADAWLLIGEHPATGRSLAHRLPARADPAELVLVMEPWAELHGEVVAPRDTHVHLTPAVPVVRDPSEPFYRTEVPIVGGRWRARVPAVPHDVRLVRSSVRFESALAAVRVAPAPGAQVAVPLGSPGNVELIVRVRGDRAVEVAHAGVVFLAGHRGERTLSGSEMMHAYGEERGAARASETFPDGEGGSLVSLPNVQPGKYTVCAAAVPGDLHDPALRARVMAHAGLLEGPCRHILVAAEPARQEVIVEVPPPRRLPPLPAP